ncbi:hypothetical protein VSH64_10175 [Amycolatopsis rhabdoformis]|uniref:HEAT repeat domain-containing protein n=1 Tax=Amycolatopsis rhabdoformis TaxID=1448059 RepID=A0ABZ1IGA4_9PSEU|nr:hypothetical protein [Amycolatopsis rhabdoformis]WSE32470.1 hypothetical protein VSH64_10175 [Amycolatopsis rhabdoformis]
MDDEARRAVVAALIRLAESPDHRDRAEAGRGLAGFAERPEAVAPLVTLVLDEKNTFVTRATAQALLRRQDPAGFAVVAAALSAAGPGHADWIGTAVHDVFGVSAEDRDSAVAACTTLGRTADEQVRRGVDLVIELLAESDPIVHTARRD